MREKEKEKMQTIELIMFADCTEETLDKLKAECEDVNWTIGLSPELLALLHNAKVKIFERHPENRDFFNEKEEKLEQRIRELEKQVAER